MAPAIVLIPIALTVAAAAASAVGGYMQAQAQADSADYNAQVASNNATIEAQNAQLALAQSAADTQARRDQNRRIAGAMIAGGAKGGGNLTGSFLDVQKDSLIEGELGALNTRYAGIMQARGHSVAATNYQAQAGLARMEARSARRAGTVGLVTSAIQGASSSFSTYDRFASRGVQPSSPGGVPNF